MTTDPLAAYRDRFVGAGTGLVYFDGNSLGRPLAVTAEHLAAFVTDEWGGRLIRGWDERWFDLPLTLGDEIGRVCLGMDIDPKYVDVAVLRWQEFTGKTAVLEDGRTFAEVREARQSARA